MKNKKVRAVYLIWVIIGIVLLIFIWSCNRSGNYLMQRDLTYAVRLYIGISCILAGAFAWFSKNGR